MHRVAAIVLAAGGSSRMGRPKQLLPLQGRALLVRTVQTALLAGCRPVVVVLGRDAIACGGALARWRVSIGPVPAIGRPARYRPDLGRRGGRVVIIRNREWERGLGTSLRAGVRALGPAAASFILLCDQPGVTPETLVRLRRARASAGRPVCVAAYADTVGPPVLVGAAYLRRLRDWPDADGAKALWTACVADVTPVRCPEAAADVDTPDMYARLINAPAGHNVSGLS